MRFELRTFASLPKAVCHPQRTRQSRKGQYECRLCVFLNICKKTLEARAYPERQDDEVLRVLPGVDVQWDQTCAIARIVRQTQCKNDRIPSYVTGLLSHNTTILYQL